MIRLAAASLAAAALALAACGAREPDDPARAALARGARWLWSQQDRDGGWHSKTYGLLRDGHSLSALALATLLALPADAPPPPPRAVDRAADFLVRNLDAHGSLGTGALVPDYPNYATALAVVALERAGGHDAAVARMRACLRTQQFADELGYRPDDPAYGGFGMGGPPRPAPHHGHLDLSMTRHVLEAFAGLAGDGRLAARAARFLDRCRTADGGFLFSPAVEGANKAGADSYGTTTADGVLALLAIGVARDDPRVAGATGWLSRAHRPDAVPGFAEGSPWAQGLWMYWAAASSRALAAAGAEGAWRASITAELVRRQAADGSWRNPSNQVKEDDPLIATSLALQALAAAAR